MTERRGLARASNRGLSQREKRINRNWVELLQELRVTQTGVQVLTAFLLTVPFSNRFSHLSQLERITYLCILTGSIATTALLVAPWGALPLAAEARHRRRRQAGVTSMRS